MASFLFVHGAFQGGWVWGKVLTLLQNQGHAVHAPTLSGCGYLYLESSPENDLKTYIRDKASYLDTVSGREYPTAGLRPEYDLVTYIKDMERYLEIEGLNDVVLVGHSYSGMICGALMSQSAQRIRQAIFVDAVIPESNRSFVDIAGEQFKQMLAQHRLDNEYVRPWPVKVFGVTGPETAWFESRLQPFPHQAFHTNFPGVFDPTIRAASFISCGQTMSPFIQEMAVKAKKLSWPVYQLDTGHCPMISCPEALVEHLTSIVRQADTTL